MTNITYVDHNGETIAYGSSAIRPHIGDTVVGFGYKKYIVSGLQFDLTNDSSLHKLKVYCSLAR